MQSLVPSKTAAENLLPSTEVFVCVSIGGNRVSRDFSLGQQRRGCFRCWGKQWAYQHGYGQITRREALEKLLSPVS